MMLKIYFLTLLHVVTHLKKNWKQFRNSNQNKRVEHCNQNKMVEHCFELYFQARFLKVSIFIIACTWKVLLKV